MPYTVTCTIDSGWIIGDDVHWWMDTTEYGDTQGWPEITDPETHQVYLVIERAGLSSLPSNIVSGTDRTGWP